MKGVKIATHLCLLQSACGFSSYSPPSYRRCNSSTRLHSIPTLIDTFTSGLASIARLPYGVTVSPRVTSTFSPQIKKLFDIEHDRDCRVVREKISELDLIVEEVIPSTPESRAVASSSAPISVPTLVAVVDGKEATYSGVDDILKFFNENFSTDEQTTKDDTSNEVLLQIKDKLLAIASYLPGILRAGRGKNVCSAACIKLSPPRPTKPLTLYSYEGNQFCRLVREVLTELDVVYELRSAGKGSPRREELASITDGSSQQPYLIDPNTGTQMADSKDIVTYLYSTYALWTPPSELLRLVSNVVTPLLSPVYKVIAPLQAGSKRENEFEYTSDIERAKVDINNEISSEAVVIYTYELSPFCTESVALLRSIGIDFKEISLGKEWIPGLIEFPEKRAALLEMTGQSSLPHVFVGGKSIGGLYSGNPGLLPALERGELMGMIDQERKNRK